MDSSRVVPILNELLEHEQRAIVPRLFESTMFVSRLSLPASDWARRVVQAGAAHRAALARLILELGGVPGPRSGDVSTGDLHFQDLRSVLPRVEQDLATLIRVYRAAEARIGSDGKAASLVSEIRQTHESALTEIRELEGAAAHSN